MSATFEQWKQQVEADLKGASFDKTLVTKTDGLTIQPLYVMGPGDLRLPLPSGEGRGEAKPHLSSIEWHEQGADAVDELAVVLSQAAQRTDFSAITVELTVGRDTFIELAKLRAFRILWDKLANAANAPNSKLTIHARCSSRTLTQRDPWVNMLRTTTQVFAAMLGGADHITPTTYDQELGDSALGKRVAENTLKILSEESGLDRVADPAAGSYYLDTITDQLARAAWNRFQIWEADGGFPAIEVKLRDRLSTQWKERLSLIAKRRIPILGVSEFANVDEKLPGSPHVAAGRRDAEQFEALRLIADERKPEAILYTLGTIAETRGRVGFSSNFLTAGGIKSREVTTPEKATLAVICGTDERYATEAADAVKALKAAGTTTVIIAGKPGPNDVSGADGFIFMGSDLIETLTSFLELYR